MKKVIIAIGLLTIMSYLGTSQTIPVTVIDKDFDLNQETIHIRAYRGDILKINIQTEIRNERRETYWEFNNVKIYRQDAYQEFQHIVDRNDVSKLEYEIPVRTDGIYSIEFRRGGMRSFNTSVFVQREALNEQSAELNKPVEQVMIYDTIHTYVEGKEVYEYIRTATPHTKKEFTPQYEEEQIFIDVYYALRINNAFVIPVLFPYEIMSEYMISKSIEWGFFITVSDELNTALRNKVSQVATAALDVGLGKAVPGDINSTTGAVTKNVSRAYTVFDHASTANEIAGITADVAEINGNEKVVTKSETVQVITGFTGLSETIGDGLASFMPRVSDNVNYKILDTPNYTRFSRGEEYTTLQQGKSSHAAGKYPIRNPNDIFYIVIENGRSTQSGNAWDVAKALGSTVLSQYVYANVKVYVKRKNETKYDKGYYETTFEELTNPAWEHRQNVNSRTQIIFTEDLKPYYQKLAAPTHLY